VFGARRFKELLDLNPDHLLMVKLCGRDWSYGLARPSGGLGP